MKKSKNTYNADKENSIFATKLRGLFDETKKTQQDLIDFIQLKTGKSPTRQAVSMWLHGNSPDIKTVPIIANFFGVSTDYLLTETDIRPIDVELRAVCDYIGLSKTAVEFLHTAQNIVNGVELSPKLLDHINFREKLCDNLISKINTIFLENPEVWEIANGKQKLYRGIDGIEAHRILDRIISNEPGGCPNEIFGYLNELALEIDEPNHIERYKSQDRYEYGNALQALSKLLSAPDGLKFLYFLSLFIYTDFKDDNNRGIDITTVDKSSIDNFTKGRISSEEYFQNTNSFQLDSSVIDGALLSEMQNIIRQLKSQKSNAVFLTASSGVNIETFNESCKLEDEEDG